MVLPNILSAYRKESNRFKQQLMNFIVTGIQVEIIAKVLHGKLGTWGASGLIKIFGRTPINYIFTLALHYTLNVYLDL